MTEQTPEEKNTTRIFYNKLCRDKIPQIIRDKGFDCDVRVAEPNEYKKEIIRKVFEEAIGVTNSPDTESLKAELADLVITINAVQKEFGISDDALHEAVHKSLDEKGSYDEHLYLSWSSDTDYVSNERGHGIDD